MSIDPVVSIGMPVHNVASCILPAVRSIQKQTFSSWELLIIDDGSTDGTTELLRSIKDARIRIFADGKRRHLAARLNEAVALARGKYFARMDGDDVSFPQRLEKQLAYLQANPGVDLLGAPALIFRSDGSIRSVTRKLTDHEAICGTLWSGFELTHPTWIAETAWFRSNPYDPDATMTQDRELLLRTHKRSRFAAVPEILFGYRQDTVPLSKVVPMRRQLRSAMWRYYNADGDFLLAALSAGLETAKLGVDLVAHYSGIDYRQWRSAGVPIEESTRLQWRALWTDVNAA